MRRTVAFLGVAGLPLFKTAGRGARLGVATLGSAICGLGNGIADLRRKVGS